MNIKMLSENTSISDNLESEHGLSLYIEMANHKILFDMGLGSMFSDNAKKLGVDLSDVDLAVVSHGHHDHGGGLETFLNINSKAKIFINKNAFEGHYVNKPDGGKAYIGLDEALASNNRLVFAGNSLIIDDSLEIFSGVEIIKPNSKGNRDLMKKPGLEYVVDDFDHEQNLIIKEGEKVLLLVGCAHKGIVNIMEQFYEKRESFPDVVIGGFHLYNVSWDKYEEPEFIHNVGDYLKSTGARYYTCHCTGKEAYNELKLIMGDKVDYFAGGDEITI